MKNIEFKAHLANRAAAAKALEEFGGCKVRDHIETDTYFRSPHGRLKYRESSVRGDRLIAYYRSDNAVARESDFQIAEVQGTSRTLKKLLAESVGVISVVSKRRVTYEGDGWLANIDLLMNRYSFVEIEAHYEREDERPGAEATIRELIGKLEVCPSDILPWSYELLGAMLDASERWRSQIPLLHNRLVLIDGASAVGKSTVVRELLSMQSLNVTYVPRCTTRARRPNDTCGEYIYLTEEEFQSDVSEGNFLEFRKFLFGMSYGLRWSEITAASVTEGGVAVGLINLGNARHIKEFVPEATTILVTAPLDEVELRLRARSSHTEEQIEERLDNARKVENYAECYDYVIRNESGKLEEVTARIASIIGGLSQRK